ncbi:hypothetical protein K461DRAFT_281559 [Myriangium duriaei CBS 260.36]|uniref:Conserved oligomeric Golgi complex subunit 8 n=1 Tax=Myriangium duriaei CBS 260.36 TaxID=1168546 RepID=A0A9P4MCW3_9PEZI|nr:hypothetical protein K461DRAFT_281559 [Myriangium duriaei CBS 260.36]
MADPLLELLLPHLDDNSHAPSARDPTTRTYLDRLSTLSLKSLATTEHASLVHADQTVTRSLQALSKRSHSSITNASDHLKHLAELLTAIRGEAGSIKDGIKTLEEGSSEFAQKYERTTENQVLDKRKTAALLNRSFDRIGNILELPSLLSSTVNTSAALGGGATAGTNTAAVTSGAALTGYASALDIHAHVKRLRALYPDSNLVASVSQQSDEEISNMITVLITTLQSPTLKLAVAMRTIGWLRRVAPELSSGARARVLASSQDTTTGLMNQGNDEGALGALFLVCRLITLRRLLEALEPLKQLADQESELRQNHTAAGAPSGVQSERYLKRFIEIFREQSFAIISMYKSIFPTSLPVPETSDHGGAVPPSSTQANDDPTPALASLVPTLASLLADNLQAYMPNVTSRAARDSLLSQVLFCAGSLGRLGADFGMMLALLDDDGTEWAEAMKKHRVQASRLEVLASGVRKGNLPVSPGLTEAVPVVGAKS